MTTQFTPPGPGHWELDRSHFPGGATEIMKELITESVEEAYRKSFPVNGIPAETVNMCFVNGFTYTRLRPLISPDKPAKKNPPTFVLKVASRLHPEFRRRTKAAEAALENPPARAVIADWHASLRPSLIERNLAYTDVDLSALSDPELADHLEELIGYLRETLEHHFRLHTYDLAGIARLVFTAKGWGLTGAEVVPALAGASPSTAAPAKKIAEIREAVARAEVVPTSLDEVRAASSTAAELLDDYLRHHGSVLYAGYDLDGPTLRESPDVLLATIVNDRHADPIDEAQVDAIVADLRARVPESDRAEFDTLLADAREAMDLRDDNGPLTSEWPTGLLRLGMIEAARRLVEAGRLDEVDHIFGVARDELGPLVRGDGGPTASELTARAARRAHEKTLEPPLSLGEPEPEPPLEALPTALGNAIAMVQTVLEELGINREPETAPTDGPRLTGAGIGTEPFTGRACVANDADEAFDKLEPGDILVTRATSPAYNMVLTLVGGLVTADGGPMSHAAVLSRELNIPAVVGAPDAMDAIEDGATITVDPAAGVVTLG
ncbi:MAG: PEP-utilizing enzyme [Actinomycetota bacterium]